MVKEKEKRQVLGLREIPLTQIRKNTAALRDVQRDTEKYVGLKASIKEQGRVLESIIVTPRVDPVTNESYYLIVNGLQRFSASQELGFETIPCNVMEMDDDEVFVAQVETNLHIVDTKPVEYSEALLRYLSHHREMTETELCRKLSCSHTWLQQRLSLQKIKNPDIRKMVNEGKINLLNAYALARLSEADQVSFVDQALMEDCETFGSIVRDRLKEQRSAAMQGRKSGPKEFIPVASLRPIAELKKAREPETKIAETLVGRYKPKTTVDAFILAISWALKMDDEAVAEQRELYDARQKKLAEAKAKAIEERAQKQLQEAAAIRQDK
jgi:ParB/RepB/Spo0J family partition protein